MENHIHGKASEQLGNSDHLQCVCRCGVFCNECLLVPPLPERCNADIHRTSYGVYADPLRIPDDSVGENHKRSAHQQYASRCNNRFCRRRSCLWFLYDAKRCKNIAPGTGRSCGAGWLWAGSNIFLHCVSAHEKYGI